MLVSQGDEGAGDVPPPVEAHDLGLHVPIGCLQHKGTSPLQGSKLRVAHPLEPLRSAPSSPGNLPQLAPRHSHCLPTTGGTGLPSSPPPALLAWGHDPTATWPPERSPMARVQPQLLGLGPGQPLPPSAAPGAAGRSKEQTWVPGRGAPGIQEGAPLHDRNN